VGTFDVVYAGSLLLHLRDPVRAVERLRSVCSGRALFVEAVDGGLSRLHPRRPVATLDGAGRPWWWLPNAAGLRRMVEAGGFAVDAPVERVMLPPGRGQARPPLAAARSRQGRRELVSAYRGDPHAVVRACPS
jgi:hypothetical protein